MNSGVPAPLMSGVVPFAPGGGLSSFYGCVGTEIFQASNSALLLNVLKMTNKGVMLLSIEACSYT